MYSACQFRKMTVDNLGPTASGMNFGKYSAQNDVCSFDYSTSMRLIKMETKATQLLSLCITTIAGKRSENQS